MCEEGVAKADHEWPWMLVDETDQLIQPDAEHRHGARSDGETPLHFVAPQPKSQQQQRNQIDYVVCDQHRSADLPRRRCQRAINREKKCLIECFELNHPRNRS